MSDRPVVEAVLPGGAPTRRWRVGMLLVPIAAVLLSRGLDLLAMLVIPVHTAGTSAEVHGSRLRMRLVAGDGGWYERIAAHGYPHGLPGRVGGGTVHSALAFFPAYPTLIAILQRLVGAGFLPVALAVNLVAGAFTAVGIAQLCRRWATPSTAAFAGVLWAVQPASPVTVIPYTEAAFSAEVVALLLLLDRRRYGLAMVLLPVTALTRGTMPPLVLVVAVHVLGRLRWRGGHAGQDPTGPWPAATLAVAVLSAPLWPVLVALRTGRPDAYLVVQSSWNGRLELFVPWWRAVRAIAAVGPGQLLATKVAFATLVVAVALAVAVLRSPLSAEAKMLAPAFLLYLVAVVPPSSSYPRFLVPVITLPMAAAALLTGRAAVVRWGGLALCVLGQAMWLALYVLGLRHFTP